MKPQNYRYNGFLLLVLSASLTGCLGGGNDSSGGSSSGASGFQTSFGGGNNLPGNVLPGGTTPCATSLPAFTFLENPAVEAGDANLSFATNLSGFGQSVTAANLLGDCDLESADILLTDDGLFPNSIPTAERSLAFDPTDPEFQNVMAYYYADMVVQSVRATGAFTGMDKLKIDAHCDSENDASYSPSKQKLCLGYADVGANRIWAADDADVIMHETSHAINANLSSTAILNSTNEAGALDEALSDYWAHTNTGNPSLSEWFIRAIEDSLNVTGLGRDASENNSYPQSMINQVHNDSKVFTETLWSIRQQLGAEKTNKLVALAITLLPSVTTYQKAYDAVVDAAQALSFASADQTIIMNAFAAKGIKRNDAVANLSGSSSRATVMVIDDHTLSLQKNGNCNGILDQGETALVLINFENTGATDFGAVEMSLTENDNTISIPAGGNIGTYFRLDANSDFVDTLAGAGNNREDATISAAFAVRAGSGSAGTRNLTLRVELMGGAVATYNLALNIGTSATKSSCTKASLWP